MVKPTSGDVLPLHSQGSSTTQRDPSPADAVQLPGAVSPRRATQHRRRRRRWLLIAVVCLVIGAAVAISVLHRPPLVVTVVQVERGVVEQTVSNTRAGTVKSRRRARLSPETGGRVVALPCREGAHVAEGDLLIGLDPSLQQAQVELAEEDVRVASAQSEEACLAADLAETELSRFVRLGQRGIASEQSLDASTTDRDRTRAGCQASQAAIAQTRARLRLARAELAKTQVRAPFAGVIAELSTELGEWITPSPPGIPLDPVLDLIDQQAVYVTAPIDEMDAERVSVGQQVRISVDSHQGEQFAGALVRVADYVQDFTEQNRTVEVEAELDESDEQVLLLPGTSADIEVIVARHQGALMVPTSAIAQGGKVLVVVDNQLVEREITTGLSNWRTTEVLDGLAEGELVVTARDDVEIKAGVKVTTREES